MDKKQAPTAKEQYVTSTEELFLSNYYNIGKKGEPYAELKSELRECTELDEIDKIFNKHNFPDNIKYRTWYLYGIIGITAVF